MRLREAAARPYAWQGHDLVRRTFEERLLARVVPRLLDAAGGGALLDLGCGDGLAARLAAGRLTRYLGLDLEPSVASSAEPRPRSARWARAGRTAAVRPLPRLLRGGLAPVARASSSGCSRTSRGTRARERSSRSRRSGSTRWSGRRLWQAPVGIGAHDPLPARRGRRGPPMGASRAVHALRRCRASSRCGALDRTLQAGPKVGSGRYWPGLPPLRAALSGLLRGEPPAETLDRAAAAVAGWDAGARAPHARGCAATTSCGARPVRRGARRGDLGARAADRRRLRPRPARRRARPLTSGVRRPRRCPGAPALPSVAANAVSGQACATARASAIVSTSRSAGQRGHDQPQLLQAALLRSAGLVARHRHALEHRRVGRRGGRSSNSRRRAPGRARHRRRRWRGAPWRGRASPE